MNHSSLPRTDELILERRRQEGSVVLYLTTNKMLLGVDIADLVQVYVILEQKCLFFVVMARVRQQCMISTKYQVIMVRPPDMEHAVVQALGRAGRKKSTGQRGFSLLYLLYNAQDLGAVKGPSPGIERLCRGEGCKKQHLRSLFEGVYTKDLVAGDVACCHTCDKVVEGSI